MEPPTGGHSVGKLASITDSDQPSSLLMTAVKGFIVQTSSFHWEESRQATKPTKEEISPATETATSLATRRCWLDDGGGGEINFDLSSLFNHLKQLSMTWGGCNNIQPNDIWNNGFQHNDMQNSDRKYGST